MSHQGPREKPLSDADMLGGVRTCLHHSADGHSGELQAPLRSEPKREAPGLHNELMERFPQLSRDCGDGAGGSYPGTVLVHSRNWRDSANKRSLLKTGPSLS